MTAEYWIVGGFLAALCGGALSTVFRFPVVVLASLIVAGVAITVAHNTSASIAAQIAFTSVLLVIMQAAYLLGALVRSRRKR